MHPEESYRIDRAILKSRYLITYTLSLLFGEATLSRLRERNRTFTPPCSRLLHADRVPVDSMLPGDLMVLHKCTLPLPFLNILADMGWFDAHLRGESV